MSGLSNAIPGTAVLQFATAALGLYLTVRSLNSATSGSALEDAFNEQEALKERLLKQKEKVRRNVAAYNHTGKLIPGRQYKVRKL